MYYSPQADSTPFRCVTAEVDSDRLQLAYFILTDFQTHVLNDRFNEPTD